MNLLVIAMNAACAATTKSTVRSNQHSDRAEISGLLGSNEGRL
jgi:hypothetical protein